MASRSMADLADIIHPAVAYAAPYQALGRFFFSSLSATVVAVLIALQSYEKFYNDRYL